MVSQTLSVLTPDGLLHKQYMIKPLDKNPRISGEFTWLAILCAYGHPLMLRKSHYPYITPWRKND